MTKTIAFSAVAFFAAALLGSPAAAAENVTEREVHDRAQIEKLMWQYVRALDTENADAYAAVLHTGWAIRQRRQCRQRTGSA